MKDSERTSSQFAADLCATLGISPEKADRLAEILDDRMRQIADEQASEALDCEFNRGSYSGW